MSDDSTVFELLKSSGFDLCFTYHADSILRDAFGDITLELQSILLGVQIPLRELVSGGGGEAHVTQRLRRSLERAGWHKTVFRVEKRLNDETTFAQTHEIDHVRRSSVGTIALEIEWNNKDPFFDRDLENFSRLHADGGISAGIIVTRGKSLQEGMEARVREFAEQRAVRDFSDLKAFGVNPTQRQRNAVSRDVEERRQPFARAWAARFVQDKFGAATTHWSKLAGRIERGVGSPCPIVGIGLPLQCVIEQEIEA